MSRRGYRDEVWPTYLLQYLPHPFYGIQSGINALISRHKITVFPQSSRDILGYARVSLFGVVLVQYMPVFYICLIVFPLPYHLYLRKIVILQPAIGKQHTRFPWVYEPQLPPPPDSRRFPELLCSRFSFRSCLTVFSWTGLVFAFFCSLPPASGWFSLPASSRGNVSLFVAATHLMHSVIFEWKLPGCSGYSRKWPRWTHLLSPTR